MKIVRKNENLGFTILELMISLFVGAFILSGVMFTYIGMKKTTSDTMDIGELQESGRLAMNLLKRDIELAGFWGNLILTPNEYVLNAPSPKDPDPDCYFGINNRTYPQVGVGTEFKVLYAKVAEYSSELNCIASPLTGSDIIQVKHVLGQEFNGVSDNHDTYFLANLQQGRFMNGTGSVINPSNDNEKVWEYSHNVYFVQDQTYSLNGKDVVVPTLRRMRLSNGAMRAETLMEGVENIRFIFGLDTNSDFRVDTYKTASQMTQSDWDQQNSVVTSVQVFLLLRTLEEDFSSPSKKQTFILGGEGEQQRVLSFDDRYRRKLLTSTIRLGNVGSDKWSI